MYVLEHYVYSKCAEFLPEHDGAIIIKIRQLIHLIFVKIWGNGKIYNNSILWILNCEEFLTV